MSVVRPLRLRPRTLAVKFLLIVFLGALLPLALVGFWLTRSAERSGAMLLRTQLETAADAMVASIDRRWALREGELQLLVHNTAATAALTKGALSSVDSAYLIQVAQAVGPSISSIRYTDATGRERWSFRSDNFGVGSMGARSEQAQREVNVKLPVTGDGRTLGTLIAGVRLPSILSADFGHVPAPGAMVMIAGADGVLWSSGPEPSTAPTENAALGLEVVRRAPRTAPLQITISAPTAPFIKPFEQAARTGLAVLMTVAAIAFVISAVLTSRATGSLVRLSDAAAAVAAGDLDRRVPVSDGDEIGQLAVAFNEMTQSLRRTLGELSQQRALAAVGEFAASLSHEVRNALTAIRVDLQHSKRHLPPDNPGTALLVRALDSVRRLDSTVTSALRAARTGQVVPSRVELRLVLEQAMRGASPSFVERAATLEPLASDASVEIDGDASALEQMFLNLLINAGEALGEGGRARVEIARVNGHAIVRIIDTGGGIPQEQLARFGQPFRSTKPHGTGLGVPIARRIAQAHGGELRVESVQHIGTTASVQLPLAVGLRATPQSVDENSLGPESHPSR